jgi:hypothetical protein
MFGFKTTNLTEITVLLDRSGSMHAVQEETVEGFAAFVQKQRQVGGPCRLTLHQFDTVYETVYCNRPIHRVPSLRLVPRGGTALLDAMGKCIRDNADRTARLSVASRPFRTIMVIITDGLENSSREFRRGHISSLVRHHTEHQDWQFVYLGANQDAIYEAGRIGIDQDAAMTYTANHRGTTNAWGATAEAVARHRCAPGRRVAGSYFTREERRRAID